MTSPTARSLAELRRLGYLAEVVEQWVPQAGIRKDLFGFIDILGIGQDKVALGGPLRLDHPGPRILAVQATSGTNHADRVAKIKAHQNLAIVLDAGIAVQVWSWSKRGPRGSRKLWTLRREEITAAPAASPLPAHKRTRPDPTATADAPGRRA